MNDISESNKTPAAKTNNGQDIKPTDKRLIIVLFIVLVSPVLLSMGFAYWRVFDTMVWSQHLYLIGILCVFILSFLCRKYAKDKYWTRFEDSKIFSAENRQDAAAIIPTVLLVGLISTRPEVGHSQIFITYFKYILIISFGFIVIRRLSRRFTWNTNSD